MSKTLQGQNWLLTPAADGRRYSKYPAGDPPTTLATWNLPATISIPAGTSVGVRQYTANATGWTIAVTGLAVAGSPSVGLTYNAGTESIDAAETTALSGTATFTLSKTGETDVVDTATVALLAAEAVPDATIFVQSGGSDGNAGTSVSPYATLAKAISVAVAGDVIEMRAASAGGTWTYTAYTTINRSGTSGNEITIRVRDGDRVNFYPPATGGAILDFSGANYWKLDGSQGQMWIGNRANWSSANGGTNNYPNSRTILGNSSTYIQILGSQQQPIQFGGGTSSVSFLVNNTCSKWRLRDLRCSGYGRVNETSHSGDGIRVLAQSVIIDRCEFVAPYGGHNLTNSFNHSNVVRNCVYNGDWPAVTGLQYGYRVAGFSCGKTERGGDAPYGPFLVEDCVFKNIFNANDDYTRTSIAKELGHRLIVRRCFTFDSTAKDAGATQTWLGTVSGSLDGVNEHNAVERIRNYNNTQFNVANIIIVGGSTGTSLEGGVRPLNLLQDMRWVNNIYAEVKQTERPGWGSYIVHWAGMDDRGINKQGYSNWWLGARFDGNLIHADGYGIRLHGTESGVAHTLAVSSLAAAQSTWPGTWLANNATTRATFVNEGARTISGFALAGGSAGEGTAVPMAAVTAGSSGTAVALDDAFWIYDGFGLEYFGEQGDYVAFYDSTSTTLKGIRQVASVVSQTSITLASAITVVSGDVVYPVLPDGVTVCRNKGAAQ